MTTPFEWVRTTLVRRAGQPDREAGAVLVMTVLFLTVALLMAAIVLDLAQLRLDRASNRRTADLVATAAATTIATPGGTGTSACQDAWSYFLANTENAGQIEQTPACSTTFGSACNADTARTATGEVGDYTFKMTYPVPYGSTMLDAPDVVGGTTQSFYGTVDGTPCERVGIAIQQVQKMTLA